MADRPARKNKDILKDIQPTDIDEKLTALLRRNAASAIRTRDRSQQQPAVAPSPPQPQQSSRSPKHPAAATQRRTNHVLVEADHNDFSRRLKISSSPAPHHRTLPKLFDPQSDPIPLRKTTEPEAMSDVTSSSHQHQPHPPPSPNHPSRDRERNSKDAPARQLFDHRKDDPVRFSVLARPNRDRPTPTPKSSADYVSASSTSSYANSMTSSAFTLSSTTDGSSASSALFERSGSRGDDGGNAFSIQLKKLYRAITNLETKIQKEDADDNDGEEDGSIMRIEPRVVLKGKNTETTVPLTEEDIEKKKWKAHIQNHKQLAEYIHHLLEISLSPSVPASLRNIPTKYNIIVRLWTYAFHKLLKSLRRASFTSPLALEHLQDFIYYAYTFYTGLLEEPTLSEFKSGWLEALGDLARYRMAVVAMVGGAGSTVAPGRKLTLKEVKDAVAKDDTADGSDRLRPPKASKASTSDGRIARIDDSPSPSVGVVAARLLELEPETERWRGIARDWYGLGLAEQPGTGKLHHHLGLLCRDIAGKELKGVYHFVKSMTTLHPFPTSRESVLPIWSVSNQTRRMNPDTPTSGLFVLLHGMLFTHIQLDDFEPSLARFMERLSIDGPEEREWIMMAIINLAAIFEYGRSGSVLGRVGGREGVGMPTPIVMTRQSAVHLDDQGMVMDRSSPKTRMAQANQISPANSEAGADETPVQDSLPSFNHALQLAFSMLSYVLKHPTLTMTDSFTKPNPNPYLTIMLTFLATTLKNPRALSLLERNIPWEELSTFFSTHIPERVMIKQGLITDERKHAKEKEDGPRWVMLTSGCAPPLPEDWSMRGMEWVGRSVFERGYWKSGEERRAEIEVLEEREVPDEMSDGRIEDDHEDEAAAIKSGNDDTVIKRWIRIVRSAMGMSTSVDGLSRGEGTREWKVEGHLAEKVRLWQEQRRVEQEEAERRRLGTRWSDDYMDVDEETIDLSEEEDNEDDTPEVKELKARRKYLQGLLQSVDRGATIGPSSPPRRPKTSSRKLAGARPSIRIVPGYSVFVVDTNILLSSLHMFASVVESHRWTVVVPLPVIMELDGLSSNTSAQLSEAAQNALTYVSSHVRSHSVSLKVQTTKGNYLTNLNIRTENVDFTAGGNWERNMDDLILKITIWQEEHWVDRTSILKADPPTSPVSNAAKVVLLSLDRNLRLKARSRQLPAASERDLATILASAA